MLKQDYEKIKLSVRSQLLGMNFYVALRCMEFAERFHCGERSRLRKDGNPEFSHQISQVGYALTILSHFLQKENLICTVFLHDVCEDYDVSYDEIESSFGRDIRMSVEKMTKVYRGVKKPTDVYYAELSSDPTASAAKGIDRIHNLMTMVGGFKEEKQKDYIKETMDFAIPMLKKSRRLYPEQNLSYENMKIVMTNQITIYAAMHEKD